MEMLLHNVSHLTNCLNSVTNTSIQTSHDEYFEFFDYARFLTGLVLYPTTCLVGFFGNLISIVVLSTKKMRNSTNTFLLTLAFADTIKIVTDFLYFVVVMRMHINLADGEHLLGVLYPYNHYLTNMSLCASAWLTVSVAVERYILVCIPTRSKELCSIQRARIVCFIVFSGVIIITIPYALRYKKVTVVITSVNCTERTASAVNLTELWQNDRFAKPYNWLHTCFRTLVPLLVLSVLNSLILVGLRKTRVAKRKSSTTQRITFMLLLIVCIFVLCVTPDAVMSTILNQGYNEEGNLTKGVREITDFLLLVNSAINFIPYCVFNKQFRKHFLRIFCPSIYRRYEKNATPTNADVSVCSAKPLKQIRTFTPETQVILHSSHNNGRDILSRNSDDSLTGKQPLCNRVPES